MAICRDCDLDMRTAEGCTLATVEIGGEEVPRYRHRRARGSPTGRCGDCGATPGTFHHLGCDLERCPRCRRQLITCGCWTDGEDEEDEPDDVPWWDLPSSSSTRCRHRPHR